VSVELSVPEAEVSAPVFGVHATASAATTGCKQQIHDRLGVVSQLADASIALEIAFVLGARRNWPNLWEAAIDALDLLLGRTRPIRGWHPPEGWVNELGLLCVRGQPFGADVLNHLAARSIGQTT
jgi:hypothetical protein